MSRYDNPYTGTLNGWYECVVHSNVYMTKGKLYFFHEGQTIYDNDTLSSRCDNVSHFNSGKVAKIKKTKKAEDMVMSEMLNGHYKCTRGFKDHMTEGKIYTFEGGRYVRDNGEKSATFSNVQTYNVFCKSQIEPYTGTLQPDKSKLKSGDKLIYRGGGERYVLLEVDKVYDSEGRHDTFVSSYHPDLTWESNRKTQRDVMEVYRDGVLIMKREEKTAQEIEIERIESEMRALAEAQNKLADDLKKVRGQK